MSLICPFLTSKVFDVISESQIRSLARHQTPLALKLITEPDPALLPFCRSLASQTAPIIVLLPILIDSS